MTTLRNPGHVNGNSTNPQVCHGGVFDLKIESLTSGARVDVAVELSWGILKLEWTAI